MKLAEAEIMRKLDGAAINDYGIPGVVLMENAGKGTVDAMISNYGPLANKAVSIIVGPGNNGGDGLVIARHLHQLGSRPHVFMMVDPEKLTGDAAINYKIVDKLPIDLVFVKESDDFHVFAAFFKHSAIVVDAIFGTGLKREVAGIFAKMIGLINQVGRPVVAVDIASGLDSDSGKPLGCSVVADLTVTYGLVKPGHVSYPGTELTGKLQVVDIGIPPEVVEQAAIKLDLLQKKEVSGLLPARAQTSHKGTFGHLLVLAGSQGKTGAAILAVNAALRSGVGLVSLGTPQQLNSIYESSLLEAMTVPLASDFYYKEDDYPAISSALQQKSALVLGPGIGTTEETGVLVRRLLAEINLPMVVDADALNIVAGDKAILSPAPRIFTPHPGEMARLTGMTTKEVQADRRAISEQYASDHNVTVVLKGAATIIASPDGRTAINPTGNPGMAAGGTGDVLAGLIGSLLAQGLSPWEAACLGVYVHGLAADRIAGNNGIQSGFLASELADELPLALHELEEV